MTTKAKETNPRVETKEAKPSPKGKANPSINLGIDLGMLEKRS